MLNHSQFQCIKMGCINQAQMVGCFFDRVYHMIYHMNSFKSPLVYVQYLASTHLKPLMKESMIGIANFPTIRKKFATRSTWRCSHVPAWIGSSANFPGNQRTLLSQGTCKAWRRVFWSGPWRVQGSGLSGKLLGDDSCCDVTKKNYGCWEGKIIPK